MNNNTPSLLRIALIEERTVAVNDRWYGVLTASNIDSVAEVVRGILKDRFCIAEALYCDSQHADLRLISPDCSIDSRWTSSPVDEPVRVFKDNGDYWIGFSASGYLWMFTARMDNVPEHEDYRYPYFVFGGDRFVVTERAPAGQGYLHKRAFGAIGERETA